MITVRLVGGLGNQMFQYAYGRALMQKYSVQFMNHCGQYGMSVDKFNTQIQINNTPEGPARSEKGLPYDSSEITVADPSVLYGYWQCERYFLDVESELRQEFTLKEPTSAAIGCSNSVAVHIRRGDYLTWAAECHGALPLDYYLKAAKHLAEGFQGLRFFVFTDDQGWAQNNFRFPYPTSVIHTTPHEDLILFSKCRHAIIANSSFSWWGAWLGADKTGTVIAPKDWFRTKEYDSRDIVPERWLRI